MRQHGGEQLIRRSAMVRARGLQQGDGFGHRAALHGRVALQQTLQQLIRRHAGISL
jgi:hypothetical protein